MVTAEYARLEDRKVIPCTMEEWGESYERTKKTRVVGNLTFGAIRVSTVFLGLNHGSDLEPRFFETMVFGFDKEIQTRCATYEEAEVQHEAHVDLVWRVLQGDIQALEFLVS